MVYTSVKHDLLFWENIIYSFPETKWPEKIHLRKIK